MADTSEIKEALELLLTAALPMTPRTEKIPGVVQTWLHVFDDVPGPVLLVAVRDYLKTGEQWPPPATIRKLAKMVSSNNGNSRTFWTPRQNVVRILSEPWAKQEIDRLEREIGDLLHKRGTWFEDQHIEFETINPDGSRRTCKVRTARTRKTDLTADDRARYERAIGAPIGSQEESDYWARLIQGAYPT